MTNRQNIMSDDNDKDVDLEDEQQDEDLEDLDEDEETSDEEEEDDDDEDGDDEDDEDGDKPVTKKDLMNFRKGVQKDIDKRFIKRRIEKKSKSYQPPSKGRKDEEWRQGVEKDLNSFKTSERKRQFGYEHSLSPEEVDAVFRLDPNPTAKTLKLPFVVGGLAQIRAARNADDNTPSGGSKKSVKFNGKEWKDLKPEDKEANFQARREQILKNKGRR